MSLHWLSEHCRGCKTRGGTLATAVDGGGVMTTRWFGAPVQRTEDPRLLRGKGNFVDDIDLPEMLHAAVLRSPYARARIMHINVDAARALEGVHLVLTATDLGDVLEPSPLLVP